MQRASYVSDSGRFHVERDKVGSERLYVVRDAETGEAVWPPDMPGVDERWEAQLQADRLDVAALMSA